MAVYVELDGPKVYLQAGEFNGVARNELLREAALAGLETGGTWIAKPVTPEQAQRLVQLLSAAPS